MRYLLLLTAIFFAWASASCQTTQRIKLTQLERSAIVEGARSGQIGLTNANGDQRYAQYVEVNLTPIAYVPATSGNANNLSEFVVDPNADVWFIDWQGNAIQLKVCDNDWLVIGNNECPDAVTDSIYHYKYAAIGARYVWPNAEFLVSDSVGVGISGISGNRNARLFLYDQGSTGAFTIDQGGSSTLMYIEQNGELRVATSTGTAETPILGTNHFAVNATDSTVQMHRYPQTRNDTGNPVNVLSTDATGKVRSHPVAEVVSAAGGVTGSGAIPQVAYFNGASSVTGEAAFTYESGSNSLNVIDTLLNGNVYIRLLGSSGSYLDMSRSNPTNTAIIRMYGTARTQHNYSIGMFPTETISGTSFSNHLKIRNVFRGLDNIVIGNASSDFGASMLFSAYFTGQFRFVNQNNNTKLTVNLPFSSTPEASAIMQLESTNMGFLPPRMTTAQRNAIATPANGLIIFCTDCTATDGSTGVSQTYSSSAWRNHY